MQTTAMDQREAADRTVLRAARGLRPGRIRDNLEKTGMYRTVQVAGGVTAQGPLLRSLRDGRLTVDAGGREVTGFPVDTREFAGNPFSLIGWRMAFGAAALAVAATFGGAAGAQAQTTILNVSYDPTREFYREYNELFQEWWVAQGNDPVEIQQSHGGSGSQARAVIDGLDAQVLTLALAGDIDAVASHSGKVPENWQELLPQNAAPYSSTIVFIVRAGNPKNIRDWDDLLRDDVAVVTPNPKTSGVARWNYIAAWAYADRAFDGDEEKIRDFVGNVYRNVPVLDTAARGATTTFVQRGIGDVLLNWENEAFLALEEFGEDTFEIVLPSVSVLAEPVAAVVEGNIHDEEQGRVARAYLEHLYSPEAQALALRYYYRAWDTSQADPEVVAKFPDLVRVPVDEYGGWGVVQPDHFGDGGVFDQIYEE